MSDQRPDSERAGRRLGALWLVRRLGAGMVTVLLVAAFVFALLEAAPGSAIGPGDDPTLSATDRARLEAALGLDRPAPERFLRYFGGLLRGDLGVSTSRSRPVAALLAEALPPTILLSGTALLLAFALGIALGTRAAARPRGTAEWAVRLGLPALDAAPPFWLGLVAILVFAWKLDWLPASHMRSPAGTGPSTPLDLLAHLALPVAVLAIPSAAAVARHQWDAMRRALAAPPAATARAMGVPERRVVWHQAFRCALQPALVLLGLGLPALVGGAAVVEVVFSWPGLGSLSQRALLARDVPLALGALLLYAGLVLAGGALAELLALWADPRLREESRR
ncbi:MAG: ABC transporter permease [Acidobacteria bacterium]|jgi:peptide/nickel transport system permease protein|nr:ABC transporter permease [Acidobacteriota bacterium]